VVGYPRGFEFLGDREEEGIESVSSDELHADGCAVGSTPNRNRHRRLAGKAVGGGEQPDASGFGLPQSPWPAMCHRCDQHRISVKPRRNRIDKCLYVPDRFRNRAVGEKSTTTRLLQNLGIDVVNRWFATQKRSQPFDRFKTNPVDDDVVGR
jgi:hypothetical protein